MRRPRPGDLYHHFYWMSDAAGNGPVSAWRYQMVIACDVGPCRQVQVLLPDGRLQLIERDHVQWGINSGSWKLISRAGP